MLRYFSMFGGLAVLTAIAHLIGRRAEDNGRRYWVWFLPAVPFGPLGTLIVFLLLEGSIQKQREQEAERKAGDHELPTSESG
jgi:uncharacterized membrane protein YhaH (DUF805 family)